LFGELPQCSLVPHGSYGEPIRLIHWEMISAGVYSRDAAALVESRRALLGLNLVGRNLPIKHRQDELLIRTRGARAPAAWRHRQAALCFGRFAQKSSELFELDVSRRVNDGRRQAGYPPCFLANPTQTPKSIMARVSYFDDKDHPELADLVGKIRAGRRGELINVYKLLLHSPPLASCWFDLISTARYKTELDGRLREIVIVRVAYLNRTEYVVKQHVPQLSTPEGLSQAECDALADWKGSQFFSDRERAALAYTDAMMRCGRISMSARSWN
jgi:alkylhydroperoxidase family enzyme